MYYTRGSENFPFLNISIEKSKCLTEVMDMFKRFISRLFLVMLSITALSFTGCQKKLAPIEETEKTRYSAQFLELFNTATQIVGYYEEKEDFSNLASLIYEALEEYHKLYDIYNNNEGINNMKTINDNAGIAPVKVDQKIIDLLLFAKEGYEITEGRMNIALGPVLKVWHDYRTEGIDDPLAAKLPPMELLEEKMKHTDINKLIINEEEQTVYLEEKEMSLDVGSIAKGYATEKVCQLAMLNGYTSVLVSVGGNVRAVGSKDGEGTPWNVGIQDPKVADANVHVVSITDASLVTSGVYQRYYTVDGKQYHHIIDSATLMPSDYFLSVSILCEDSGMADVLSTSIFNMSYEEGVKYIDSIEGVEAVWILKSGEVKYSSDFERYIIK